MKNRVVVCRDSEGEFAVFASNKKVDVLVIELDDEDEPLKLLARHKVTNIETDDYSSVGNVFRQFKKQIKARKYRFYG